MTTHQLKTTLSNLEREWSRIIKLTKNDFDLRQALTNGVETAISRCYLELERRQESDR